MAAPVSVQKEAAVYLPLAIGGAHEFDSTGWPTSSRAAALLTEFQRLVGEVSGTAGGSVSMSGHSGDGGSGLISLTEDRPERACADIPAADQFTGVSHMHPWPLDPACWRDLAACELCGLTMLKLFINSSAWVVRRVEHVAFIDECTVRRNVSIDYAAPKDAVMFSRPSGQQVRILPLAIMRRKSLVKFDFRDHSGRALPMLGLRQNQALTLAVIRAWAAAALKSHTPAEDLSQETGDFLDDVIAGDQTELWHAFKRMWKAEAGSQLCRLGTDDYFRAVLDRLADSFVLYGLHDEPFGERRLVKFSYDEPLTLRYTKSTYQPHNPDSRKEAREKPEDTPLPWWHWRALCSAMGFLPTRIKFPVPAAELARSFHFEITAPPEVSIIKAALLAGRPKPEPRPAATTPAASATGQIKRPATMRDRERRRPSFDSITGGYPTVDLHVAEVPYGSRSRAQVEVEARVGGWFGTAVLSSWLASGILLFAYLASPQLGIGSTLLMSFAAGLAVLLVRQDPHRLVTRLLSKVRLLATFAALLALAAAVVMASNNPDTHSWLLTLFIASLVPTLLIFTSWLLALSRSLRGKPKESPWEHHRPRKSKLESEDPELATQLKNETRHETLARKMEDKPYPYDWAHHKLGFPRPAIRVASSEGERHTHKWDKAFARTFHARLETYLEVTAAQGSGRTAPTLNARPEADLGGRN
jgi:hypothetical protein